MPEVGNVCESEELLGTSSSSSPDANMDINQEAEEVLVTKENDHEMDESSSGTGSEVFLTPNL